MFMWIGENIESYFEEMWQRTITIITIATILVSNIPNGSKKLLVLFAQFYASWGYRRCYFEENKRDIVAPIVMICFSSED